MAAKRILLLTDWIVQGDDWSFLRELRKLGHVCETVGMDITRSYGSRLKKIIYLWSGYFLIGLKGFLQRKDFDVVIAYQGVAGLFYSFFRMLTFRRPPELVLMAFFFKKRKSRLYTKLRYYFTKLALAGIDTVICYSSKESQYYNEFFDCKTEKFRFVPYGVNLERLTKMAKQREHGNYLFSAGSSNRDYRTLFEAVSGLPVPVIVFAKKYNVSGLTIPDNVEMKYDVYGDEYYKNLLGAKLVVIPLDDPELSSGQMVLLESMALGKATVVSNVWGVTDYTNGRNAILVEVRNSSALRKAIESLTADSQRIEQLCMYAVQSVSKKFTVRDMATGVAKAMA